MRDETVELLRALDAGVDRARTTAAGAAAKDRAEGRDALFAEMAERATAAGALITDPRALALLWDVMIGVTVGTLRHRQANWNIMITADDDQAEPSQCGTYRCIGGWLVALRHPGRPALDIAMDPFPYASHYRRQDSAHHRADDGTVLDIEREALRILFGDALADARDLIEGGQFTIGDAADLDQEITTDRVIAQWRAACKMFDGSNTLAECWAAVTDATGGVLAVPSELADRVGNA
jgi:hypothetical protein